MCPMHDIMVFRNMAIVCWTIQYPQHSPMPRQRSPYEDNDTLMDGSGKLAP